MPKPVLILQYCFMVRSITLIKVQLNSQLQAVFVPHHETCHRKMDVVH